MKIKIIGGYSNDWDLEAAVNNWLEENKKNIFIIDLKYDRDTIVILYNENNYIKPDYDAERKIREVIGLEPIYQKIN